jgi:hypothetical protein
MADGSDVFDRWGYGLDGSVGRQQPTGWRIAASASFASSSVPHGDPLRDAQGGPQDRARGSIGVLCASPAPAVSFATGVDRGGVCGIRTGRA